MQPLSTESTRLLSSESKNSYNFAREDGLGTFSRQELKAIDQKKKCAMLLIGLVLVGLICLVAIFATGMDEVQKSFSASKEAASKKNKNDILPLDARDSVTSPNIIFIVMDDMGYSDMSSRGAEFDTPNLDLLYKNSIVIDSHYIGLVCSPSRSQMITGRYAWNMGVSHQTAYGAIQINAFPTGMPTIGNLLQRYTNYRTYWTGKWHLGHATQSHLPLQRGFEKFYGFYTSNLDYNDKTISSTYYDTDYMDWRNMDNIDYETQYDYSTFVTGDYMLDIINSHVSEYSIDTPFYLQVPFQAVHATLATVESENSDTCNSIANANRQLVCQAILAVDEVIGKLIKNLKHETNVWDNTMIVFTSDNGGTFRKGSCNYPLRGGKEKYFEGGIKTLAFMAGGWIENIQKNFNENEDISRRTELMHSTDWVPTLLNIAGADLDQIESDLQDYLYVPVSKSVSSKLRGSDKYYQDYLMQESFDGSDVSEWLLFGDSDSNGRTEAPLSINTIDDESSREYDVSTVFKSKYTNNYYKLMYLIDEIGPHTKNTELCTFAASTEENEVDDESIEDTDETDDHDDSNELKSIDSTKSILATNEEDTAEDGTDKVRDYILSKFDETGMFLFDLTLEPNELTNLMEYYLDDYETVTVSKRKEVAEYTNKEMNDVNDYDENLVSLIWNEGIEKIKANMKDSVLANDYLNCAYGTKYVTQADPSNFGNAYDWFLSWDEYTTQFDHVCGSYVNPVLKELFQTKFDDYLTDS